VNNNRSFWVPLTPHAFRGFPIVLFLATVSLPVFTGCEFRRVVVNHPIDSQTLQTLNPGESDIRDVVQVLGAPDEIEANPDGMVFRYRYGDTKTLRVNFGWIFRFFLPVAPSMNLSRGEDVPQVLNVALNRYGFFDQYMFQQPPDPPKFSFWPF